MSGETQAQVSGWTIDTYASFQVALTAADARYEAMKERLEQRVAAVREQCEQERDRRYSEVATEREKALKIKETADLAALGLAREIQTYKDEKANELREQINSERGEYASKNDLRAAVEKMEETLKPMVSFVAAAQGRGAGVADSRQMLTWLLGIALALVALYTFTQKTPSATPIYYPAPVGSMLPANTPTQVPR
jgi:hypothetical protein